ncbi:alpha/beta hydrolase, partial [Rhizobium leguminosarum]|uniref:alpha/beta hydrolase n=1 Tax=Rhizobium leguminosarum TaxID=384 RepID=UPI003F988021
STNYSRDALEELLTRTAANPSVSDITIMAHSMGTWLTVEALRQMAIRNGHVAPKINNVILRHCRNFYWLSGRQAPTLSPTEPTVL